MGREIRRVPRIGSIQRWMCLASNATIRCTTRRMNQPARKGWMGSRHINQKSAAAWIIESTVATIQSAHITDRGRTKRRHGINSGKQ